MRSAETNGGKKGYGSTDTGTDRKSVSYTHLDVYKRQRQELSYNEFVQMVEAGEVDSIKVGSTEITVIPKTVSYTHLDVYKRQTVYSGYMQRRNQRCQDVPVCRGGG